MCRNDFIQDLEENGRFLYLTDTRPGSSGSPVFDDDWLVVGIHRGATAATSTETVKGEKIKYNNVGVWLRNVVKDLSEEIRSEIIRYQTHFLDQ